VLKVRALVALPTIRDPSLNFFVDAAEKEPRRAAVDTRGWLSEGPGRRADTFPRFFLHFFIFSWAKPTVGARVLWRQLRISSSFEGAVQPETHRLEVRRPSRSAEDLLWDEFFRG